MIRPRVDRASIEAALPQSTAAYSMPPAALADLVFLEHWERDPAPGPATARRVLQIRRAHPELAEEIRRKSMVRP